jgi:hypothetical protein
MLKLVDSYELLFNQTLFLHCWQSFRVAFVTRPGERWGGERKKVYYSFYDSSFYCWLTLFIPGPHGNL